MTNRYQIPQHDEAPSEEMIEWLHENLEDWNGEPDGITLIHNDGTEEHGAPGDWVVRDEHGMYRIEKETADETRG